jgi:hypothetical protein
MFVTLPLGHVVLRLAEKSVLRTKKRHCGRNAREFPASAGQNGWTQAIIAEVNPTIGLRVLAAQYASALSPAWGPVCTLLLVRRGALSANPSRSFQARWGEKRR